MVVKINHQKDNTSREMTQSYDKNPYTNRKFENQWTTQNAIKNFDYITIADQLRTVSGSNIVIQLVWLNRFTGTQ